jgi:antitoxin component YwqK of YwqJK toxin-antitoxin module
MKKLILSLLTPLLLFSEEIPDELFTPEQEANIIEACGKHRVVSFSQALRELIPGIADEYFDEEYLKKIETLEKKRYSGEYTDYWDNGQLRTRLTFVKGVPDGHFHGWFPNGGEAFKGHLAMGQKKGIHIAFFYSERVYKMHSPMGRIVYYDEAGNLHGSGEAKYRRSRTLKTLLEFKHGKKDGKFLLYTIDGFGPYTSKFFKEGKEVAAPP